MSKLVIFSTEKKSLWYKSPAIVNSDLNLNPVGKGNSHRKPKVVTKTRASAKAPPKVVNPIFEEMVQMTTDPFWKTSFREASIGRFNRGICFKNGCILYKARNKTDKCDISGLEVEEAMYEVQSFMRKTASIISKIDTKINGEELKRIASENIEISSGTTSWSQIRSINNQVTLVNDYVTTIGITLGLSEEEEDSLIGFIMLAIINKRFNSSNINMFNSVIHNIDGLVRGEDGIFKINEEICPVLPYSKTLEEEEEEEEEAPGSSVNIMKEWNKFTKDMARRDPKNIPNYFGNPSRDTPYFSSDDEYIFKPIPSVSI
jgi:hypothetical protein